MVVHTDKTKQRVTNELVEFEKYQLKNKTLKKTTNHFRGMYGIYPQFIKKTKRCQNGTTLNMIFSV
jgi:hypothetical protein